MSDHAPVDAVDFSYARTVRLSLIVGGVGAVLSVLGWIFSPRQFFESYLVSYLFWLGLALGSLSVTLLHNLVGGNWGYAIRRLLESGTRTVPLMALLILPLLLGLPQLYIWAQPDAMAHDEVLHQKAAYLNIPFFLVRLVIYFAIWLALSWLINRWSEDRNEPYYLPRFKAISGPGLIIFAFSVTFAVIDLVMSLEPHWFSTMYGAIYLVGQALSILAFSVAVLWLLSVYRPFAGFVQPLHFHDLGNLLLAFSMLWAYTSFSQFLIIWSGNLPEETPFYLKRLNNGYEWVALALLLFQFVLPFMLLLLRFVKRRGNLLSRLALLIIFMRLVDLFWQVRPALDDSLHVHWLDLAIPLMMGGLWVATFFWQLSRRPLLPAYVPPIQGGH